jgi:hypothetical protein
MSAETAFVTLPTGIIFLLFTCIHFWVWGILRKMGGPRVRRPPMKWSAIAESLSNACLQHQHRLMLHTKVHEDYQSDTDLISEQKKNDIILSLQKEMLIPCSVRRGILAL